MTRRDIAALLLLAALWGASFLFMRMGAGEFGPMALSALRVTIAAACLLPLLLLELGGPASTWRMLEQHAGAIMVIGLLNSALPFALISFATLTLTAGFAAVINASAPMWGALFGQLVFGQRMSGAQKIGLAIGFGGVSLLTWARTGGAAVTVSGVAPHAVVVAVAAGLLAAASYGLAAHLARRRLAGVSPMVGAAGSQIGAAIWLALPAAFSWPATPPSAQAWGALFALALFSTAAAYVLYFKLIASAGADKAVSVTFLIPLFAMTWGAMFLGERIDAPMVAGCAAILLGTALATGVLRRPGRRAS